jgi:hypothetical protein
LKYLILGSPNTERLKIVIVGFFSVSFLLFGPNIVMMSSYAEPQGELPPQLQQQLQQQQQQQQQGQSSNATASPSSQLQQQAPPITFQQGEGEGEEPCDGAYFVGPGGVTKCM